MRPDAPCGTTVAYTASDHGHAEQDGNADDGDGQLDQAVHTQRVFPDADEARQQEAAEAHAPHERAEQHTERNRGRSNDQLEQLQPDHLVDQGSTAAGDEKHQQQRQHEAAGHTTTVVLTRGHRQSIRQGLRRCFRSGASFQLGCQLKSTVESRQLDSGSRAPSPGPRSRGPRYSGTGSPGPASSLRGLPARRRRMLPCSIR